MKCKKCNKKISGRGKTGYCSPCWSNYMQSGKNNPCWKNDASHAVCIDCGQLIDPRAKRCWKCDLKQRSGRNSGVNNPNWNGSALCPECGKLKPNYDAKTCRTCFGKRERGENHPNWRGGASLIRYPREFSKSFKDRIRARYGFKCQECSCPQEECTRKLHIHHIDFDKHNLSINNLIPLCPSCHSKTVGNKDKWIKYYSNKQYQGSV